MMSRKHYNLIADVFTQAVLDHSPPQSEADSVAVATIDKLAARLADALKQDRKSTRLNSSH